MRGSRTASFRWGVPVVLLLSFGIYANALSNGFVYDDYYLVVENHWIKNLRSLPDIFSSNAAGSGSLPASYYRPIMHTVYLLTYHAFGLTPWAFHLVNILFHASVAAVVFLIVSKLAGKPSLPGYLSAPFIAATLFATHPIHTEAVTWVAGMSELSFALFFLLSFYFAIPSTANVSSSKGAHIASVTSFSLALLSKESALTLPLLILGYEYAVNKVPRWPLAFLKRYLPYLVIAGVYLSLRWHVLGGIGPFKRHAELSGYQMAINIFPLFTQYIQTLGLPFRLNAFHVFHPMRSMLEAKGLVALLSTLAFIYCTFRLRKRDPAVFLSLLFIVIPLLPVLYIPALGENTFAERYLYVPSVGFVVLVSILAVRVSSLGRGWAIAVAGVLTVVAGLYSAGVISRNTTWKDEYRLWSDTVKKSPDGAIPHTFLADVLLSEGGRIDEAVEHYQIALQLDPESDTAYNNLGLAYNAQGKIERAIESYQNALRLQPNSPETHNNLGLAYKRLGRIDKAIEQYQLALRLSPYSSGVHYNLANAYEVMGQHAKAEEHRRMAKSLENR